MQARSAAVDLLAGDTPKVGHLRVRSESRLLFGHRQHCTQVTFTGRYALGFEGCLDIVGPTLAVLDLGG